MNRHENVSEKIIAGTFMITASRAKNHQKTLDNEIIMVN